MKWSKREKEIEDLFKKYGRGKRRKSIIPFPNYNCDKENLAKVSNSVPSSFKKKELPDDAIRFPVGHSHKQGLELITPGTDLQWMGGKKT